LFGDDGATGAELKSGEVEEQEKKEL